VDILLEKIEVFKWIGVVRLLEENTIPTVIAREVAPEVQGVTEIVAGVVEVVPIAPCRTTV